MGFPKRVLLVGHENNITGASLLLAQVGALLVTREISVSAISINTNPGKINDIYTQTGVRPLQGRGMNKREFDFAICNTVVTGDVVSQIGSDLPVLWWNHELESGVKLSMSKPGIAKAHEIASAIVFQNNVQRIMRGAFLLNSSAHIHVIRNGVNQPPIKKKERARGRPFRIVCVGMLTKRKRPEDIIFAFERISDLPVELIFVGRHQSVAPEALAIARERGHKFYGEVDNQQALEIMADSDCLVHPSGSESQPLALIEAMALRLPLLVSDLPVYREMGITHGEHALLHPVGDIDLLAANIRTLATNPEIVLRLGSQGRRLWAKHFRFEPFCYAMLTAISEAYLGWPGNEDL